MPEARSSSLRAALRRELERLESGLRVLAEDVLGLETTIDLIAADGRGCTVLVLVAPAGRELEAVANGLAQAEFLRPRLRDWKKLAPRLPIDPAAGVRVVLVAPEFGNLARAAARGAGSERIRLVRCAPSGDGSQLRLRPLGAPARAGRQRVRSGFRTGLTDAELGPRRRSRVEVVS